MDFIGTLCYLLKDEFNIFLPIVLYPIIEKLNILYNHSLVCNIAFLTLQRISMILLPSISLSMDNKSIVCNLLSYNFDYLVDSITSKYNTSTTSSYNNSNDNNNDYYYAMKENEYLFLPGVVEVTLRCTFLNSSDDDSSSINNYSLANYDDNINQQQEQLHPSLNITLLSDLIHAVIYSFDRRISNVLSTFQTTSINHDNDNIKKSLHYSYLLSMSRLFKVILQSLHIMFLNITTATTTDNNSNMKSIKDDDHDCDSARSRIVNSDINDGKVNNNYNVNNNKPWLECLLLNIDNDDENTNINAMHEEEECIPPHEEQDSKDTNKDSEYDNNDEDDKSTSSSSTINTNKKEDNNTKNNNNDIQSHIKKQMELIHTILTRCTFFLSLERLKIQMNVIDSIKIGYTLLSDISLYYTQKKVSFYMC